MSTIYMVVNHRTVKSPATNELETIEQCVFYTKLKKNMEFEASVIIDLLNKKVLKNRFYLDNLKTFIEYTDRYSEDIQVAMTNWVKDNPQNYIKLKEIAKGGTTT